MSQFFFSFYLIIPLFNNTLKANIQLEPIEQPIRRKRNRRPRRFIDTEISIPVDEFRAQRENYADTLRVDVSFK